MANCKLKLIGKNGESTTIVDLPDNSENMQIENLIGFLQSDPVALQKIDNFLNENEELDFSDLKIPDRLSDLEGNYLGNFSLNSFLNENKDIELTNRAKELIEIAKQAFPQVRILRQNRPLVRSNGGNSIRGMVARMDKENPLIIINGNDSDAINNTLTHELTHLVFNRLIEESPEIKRNLKLLYEALKPSEDIGVKRVMAAIRNSGGIKNETEVFAYLFSDNSVWNYMQDKANGIKINSLFEKITGMLNSPEPTSNITVDIKEGQEEELTPDQVAKILKENNDVVPFAFSDIPLDDKKKFESGTPYEFLEKNIDNPLTVWSESIEVTNDIQLTKLKFGDIIQTPLFMYLGYDKGKGAIFGPAFKYNRSLPINQIFNMIDSNASLTDEEYAAKINEFAKDKVTPKQAGKLKEMQAKYKEDNEKYLNYKQNHIIGSVWYWEDGKTFMARVPHKFKNGEVVEFYVPLNSETILSFKSLHPDFIQKWHDGIKIDTFTDLDIDSITQEELDLAKESIDVLTEERKNETLLKTVDTKFGKIEEATDLGFKISGNYGDLSQEMKDAALGGYIKVTTKFGGKGKKNETEWMVKVSNLPGGIVVMDKSYNLQTINSNKVTSIIYNKENNPVFVEEIQNLSSKAAGFRGQQRKRIQEELFKNKSVTIYPFDKIKDDEKNPKSKEEILEKMASNLTKGDLVNVRLNIKEGDKYKPVDAIFSVLKVSGKYITVIGTSDKKQTLKIDVTQQPEFAWHKNKNDQWVYGTYDQRKGVVTPGQEVGKAFILQGFKDNSANLELQQFYNNYKENIQNYYSKDYEGDRSWSQEDNLINETEAIGQMLGEIMDPNNKFQNLSLDSQWQRTSFDAYDSYTKLTKVANLQKGDFVKSEFTFEKNGNLITGTKIAIVEKVDTSTGKIHVLVETKTGRVSNQTVDYEDIVEIGERILPITYIETESGLKYFNTLNTNFISKTLEISEEEVENNLNIISNGHPEIREDLKNSFESWIHEDRNFFTVPTNVDETEDFDEVQRLLTSRFGGKKNFNEWYQFIETLEVVNEDTGEVKRIKKDSKIPNGWIINEDAEKLSWVKRKNGMYIKKYHMDLQNMYEIRKLNFNDAQKFIRKGDIVTFEYNKGEKPKYIQGRVTESSQGKNGVIQITLLKRDKDGMLSSKKINWSNSIGTESMRIVEAFTKDKDRAKAINSYIKNNKELELNVLYTSKLKTNKSLESPKLKKSYDSAESIGYMAQNITDLYGVKASVLTNEEMLKLGNDNKVDLSNVRAFYIDGEMFINQDKASIAEPLHEITHAILPGLKSKNPELYEVIMEKVKEHPIYADIAETYSTLSDDDLDNEVFCTIFGEYYRKVMLDQGWNDWIDEDFLNFVNNTSEVVSEIFEIDNVNSSTSDLMKMSIEDIMKSFGSALVSGKFKSYISLNTTITTTQRLRNLKDKLLEKGLIKKYCLKE